MTAQGATTSTDVMHAINAYHDATGQLPCAKGMRAVLLALAGRPQPVPFQARVEPWMLHAFGADVAGDIRERGDRLLEEVLELLQAHDYDPARVATLVQYVYGRPKGAPAQEVGGVMLTLAAYCLATCVDMHAAGDVELARVWTQVEQIRAKQAAKRDLHAPVPGEACAHEHRTARSNHVRCDDCGAVYPDSGWKIARGHWFASLAVAEFYDQHGHLPQPPIAAGGMPR